MAKKMDAPKPKRTKRKKLSIQQEIDIEAKNITDELEMDKKFSNDFFKVNPIPPVIPEEEGFSVRKTVDQIAAEKRAELETQQKEAMRAPTLWELTKRFFRGK